MPISKLVSNVPCVPTRACYILSRNSLSLFTNLPCSFVSMRLNRSNSRDMLADRDRREISICASPSSPPVPEADLRNTPSLVSIGRITMDCISFCQEKRFESRIWKGSAWRIPAPASPCTMKQRFTAKIWVVKKERAPKMKISISTRREQTTRKTPPMMTLTMMTWDRRWTKAWTRIWKRPDKTQASHPRILTKSPRNARHPRAKKKRRRRRRKNLVLKRKRRNQRKPRNRSQKRLHNHNRLPRTRVGQRRRKRRILMLPRKQPAPTCFI
mmetsp:Transcript_22997/g.53340  ORF Transcript_22997/g.53340 Transcript_22997/m.53340 type:complete len:270 (+) Transcript_22997:361-1170(+)